MLDKKMRHPDTPRQLADFDMKNFLAYPWRLLGTFLLILGLAWWWHSSRPLEWEEEIRLADGEMIVARRTAEASTYGEIGGPGGWKNKGMKVEIVKPLRPDNPPIWSFSFSPILFDRDSKKNEWFIVATIDGCQEWRDFNRPTPPYVEFRVRNQQWQRVELSPIHIGRDANVLTVISSDGEPSLHTLASKAQRMSDPRIGREYTRIEGKWKLSCH